jgi:hypothetical protein
MLASWKYSIPLLLVKHPNETASVVRPSIREALGAMDTSTKRRKISADVVI